MQGRDEALRRPRGAATNDRTAQSVAPADSMKRAVVLLSGGLDSATTLALCQPGRLRAFALSFDYGQRHHLELLAAKRVAASLGVREHHVAQIDLRIFGGSALTDEIPVPKNPAKKRANSDHVRPRPKHYFPFLRAWPGVRSSARAIFSSE